MTAGTARAAIAGMAMLHFIYGKPGAGKTRLARELACTLPAITFCDDAYIAATSAPMTTTGELLDRSRHVRVR